MGIETGGGRVDGVNNVDDSPDQIARLVCDPIAECEFWFVEARSWGVLGVESDDVISCCEGEVEL